MARIPAPRTLLASFLWLGCAQADECQETKTKAASLVAEFAACGGDDRCVVVDLAPVVENPCLGAFQCFAAFTEGVDLEEFSRRARELEREFSSCRECAIAECATPESLTAVCDPTSRRCKLRRRE